MQTLTSKYNHKADGLTEDDLRRLVPSAYAVTPFSGMSKRYGFVPTTLPLAALKEAGFIPTFAQESIVRKDEHKGYAKHLLRFRREVDLGYKPEVFEISFINSHNGGSSVEMDAAFWRQICSNGLMRATKGDGLHVRHTGTIVEEVVSEALRIAQTSPELFDEIERMKSVRLTDSERELFARYALMARFGLPLPGEEQVIVEGSVTHREEEAPIPPTALTVYQPADFLRPMRYSDNGKDLFTTLNVVQEHVIKGATHIDARGKKQKSRRIQGIDQTKSLNKYLWAMAQEMLSLKNQ